MSRGSMVGGMDPNGYGAISTYTMGMTKCNENGKRRKVKECVTKNSKVFLECPKSVCGETFTMYL